MTRRNRPFLAILGVCVAAALPTALPCAAQEPDRVDWGAKAAELSELRVRVQGLRRQVEQAHTSEHTHAEAAGRALREWQQRVLTEESRNKALTAIVEARRGPIEAPEPPSAPRTAWLLELTDQLKSWVSTSIHWERAARLRALEEASVGANTPEGAYRVAQQLWALVEDELRLVTSVGAASQALTVDDSEVLAHAAHLGGVLVCARTAGGQVACGGAGHSGGLRTIPDSAQSAEVSAWIDSLRGHSKHGVFSFPLGWAASTLGAAQ